MKTLSISFITISLLSIVMIFSCSTEDQESESQARTQYNLTVNTSEGGSVTPKASGTYNEGAQLTLSAIPDEGYTFCRFLGTDNDNLICKNSKHSRCIILMNSNRYVEAFFEKKSE